MLYSAGDSEDLFGSLKSSGRVDASSLSTKSEALTVESQLKGMFLQVKLN